MLNISTAAANDAIYTEIVLGNKVAKGVANFIAPIVNVDTVTGKVFVMNDDAFVAPDNIYRAEGSNYEYYTPTLGTRTYTLAQEARAWSVPDRLDRVARTHAAKFDLRKQAIHVTMQRMENAWERRIATDITDPAKYEASNSLDLSLTPANQWDSPVADVENQIHQASVIIQRQTGLRPNKLLLSVDAYTALITNSRIRDFLPRGTMIAEESLASLFRLDEVKIADQPLILTGGSTPSNTKEYLYQNNAVLFYSPSKTTSNSFIPADHANRAEPAFAYQYILKGFPVASKQLYNELNDTWFGKIKIERSFELIGLGDNGLLSAGFLFQNCKGNSLTTI